MTEPSVTLAPRVTGATTRSATRGEIRRRHGYRRAGSVRQVCALQALPVLRWARRALPVLRWARPSLVWQPLERDEGSVVTLAAVAMVVGLLLTTIALDGTAYLAAAARAQAAADAAALAAAGASAPPSGAAPGRSLSSPAQEAAAVAEAAGGALVSCRCTADSPTMTVEVAMPVEALVVARFGPRRVVAEASAELVPPAGL